jgi:hypothetical protein
MIPEELCGGFEELLDFIVGTRPFGGVGAIHVQLFSNPKLQHRVL